MLNFEKLFEGVDPSIAMAILGLVILPATAGIIASIIAWKRNLGLIDVQRMLVQDSANGRPVWKLVARSIGRPVRNCRIRVGGKELLWEGVNAYELDIGEDGMGIAAIPFEIEQSSRITARSGPFPVFRSRFGRLEEVWMNNQPA
jgi:hypothetical protein